MRARLTLVALTVVAALLGPAAVAQAIEFEVTVTAGSPTAPSVSARACAVACPVEPLPVVTLAVIRGGVAIPGLPGPNPALRLDGGPQKGDVIVVGAGEIVQRYVYDGLPTIEKGGVEGETAFAGAFTPGLTTGSVLTAAAFTPGGATREGKVAGTSPNTYETTFTAPFACGEYIRITSTERPPPGNLSTLTTIRVREQVVPCLAPPAPPPPPPPPTDPPPPLPLPPAASPKLVVEQELIPRAATAGASAGLELRVRNEGPGGATGVRATLTPLDGLQLTTTDAACAPLGATFVCKALSLAPGARAVWRFTARPGRSGRLTSEAGAASDQGPAGQVVAFQAPVLPAPVAGRSFTAAVEEGIVLVRLPGSQRFTRLIDGRRLPLGTSVDATDGRVVITSAADRAGTLQSATFFAGRFRIRQIGRRRPITELVLDAPLACPSASPARGAAQTAAKRKRRRVRRLWGDGKGRFRTRGRNVAVTVRGTRWLTEDRCTLSLARVAEGSVFVRDLVRQRTVVLRAGGRYIARNARRP